MKRFVIGLVLSLITLFSISALAIASDVSSAKWCGTIQVTNNSTSTISGVSVNAPIGSPGLINGHYANANLTDVAAQYSGVDAAFMPGYDTNPWIFYINSIGGGQNLEYNLYASGASNGKIRYFPGSGGMTVADNTTLEPGSNFSLETSQYLAASGNIASKAGAFAETYDATTQTVTATIYNPTNATFRPNAAGDETNLSHSAGTNYGCEGDNSDATYVFTSSATYIRDLYNIPDHTSESGLIDSITYYFRLGGDSGTETVYIKPALKTSGTVYDGTEHSQVLYNDWYTYSQTYTTNPATGASWAWNDIDALQVGISLKATGGASARSADVWVVVTYEPTHVTATGVSSKEYEEITIDNPYTGGTAYKGNIHAHTTNSDGSLTPTQLMTAYKNAGYNFAAITDHDVVTSDPGVPGILFVRGVEESTTGEFYGHITSLGLASQQTSLVPQNVINAINAAGGIAGMNHPNYTFGPWPNNALDYITGYKFIEIWNHQVIGFGGASAEANWDHILSNPLRTNIWGIAADDSHNSGDVGHAYIVVYSSSLTESAILTSISNGNFYASTGATISSISVSEANDTITIVTPSSSTITWIRRDGSFQSTTDVTSSTYQVTGNEGYVRAKIINGANYAWTQPFWIHTNSIKVSMSSPYLSIGVNGDNPITPPNHDLLFNAPMWQPELNTNPFNTINSSPKSVTVNGATWSSSGYTFDGNDYLSNSTLSFTNPNIFTYMAWITTTSSARQTLFSHNNATGEPQIEINYGGSVGRVDLLYSGNVVAETATGLFGEGTPVFIAVTSTNATVGNRKIYINGIPQTLTTDSGQAFVAPTGNFWIGTRAGPGWQNFYGTLHEAVIADAAFSPAEIRQYYNSTKGEFVGGDIHTYSTTASVHDTDDYWVFFPGNVIPYAEDAIYSVNGTQKYNFMWQYGATFTSGGYTATPTFRTTSSNANVSASLTNFLPVSQSKIATFSLTSTYSILSGTPDNPGTMYTEGDYSHLPVAPINEMLDESGVPRAAWWLPFLLFGIGIIGMITYGATTMMRGPSGKLYEGQIDGSLATMAVVCEVLFIALAALGLIPLWPALVFPIPAVALVLSKKHFSWG